MGQNSSQLESKVMQNLVVLMEPSEHDQRNSLKAGNMILNRFCIDEDAAFELSGVNYLKKSSHDIEYQDEMLKRLRLFKTNLQFKDKRKEKGKEYSFLRSLGEGGGMKRL